MKLQEILADIVKKVQNRPRLFENCQSQKKPILSGVKAKRLNFHKTLNLLKTYTNRREQAVLVYLYLFKTKRGKPKKYPGDNPYPSFPSRSLEPIIQKP